MTGVNTKINADSLTEDAKIFVNTEGVFTTDFADDAVAAAKECFKAEESKIIKIVENALSCDTAV